jgi:hypothetical protein
MRPLLIGLALFAAVGFFFTACGQDPVSGASSTTGASGTGGAPNCDGVYLDLSDDGSAPCNVCVHEKCCAEMAACRDRACLVCANNSTGAGCGPESRIAEDCANAKCLSTCSPGWTPPTGSTTTTGG